MSGEGYLRCRTGTLVQTIHGRSDGKHRNSPISLTRKVPSACSVQVQGMLAVVESLPWRKACAPQGLNGLISCAPR